jgi:hypothetical protein
VIKIRLTRRALLGAMFALLPLPKPGGAQEGDRGIGGTGAVDQGDRGIGGTGVIGTIRGFGSIIVNDMRIAYSEYALLEIDGEPAAHAELRVGQVVQVVARKTETGFETDRISVTNEVVGPIASVRKGALTVLGQTVLTENIGDKGWKKGQWIAVSGLRRLDGAIVASLAEIRVARPGVRRVARVAGPVGVAPGGGMRIGGLAIAELDPTLAGRRVLVELAIAGGAAQARKTIVDPEVSAMPGVSRASIEAYVATTGGQARFGSGLTAAVSAAEGDTTLSRAFVTVSVKPGGELMASSRTPAPPPAHARPDRGPPGSQHLDGPTDASHHGVRQARTRHGAPVGRTRPGAGFKSDVRPSPHRPSPSPEPPGGRKR